MTGYMRHMGYVRDPNGKRCRPRQMHRQGTRAFRRARVRKLQVIRVPRETP